MRVGENIQRVRELLGLSQLSFAFHMNVPELAIEKLEKKKVVATQTLTKVARVLKVDIDELRFFNETEFLLLLDWSCAKDHTVKPYSDITVQVDGIEDPIQFEKIEAKWDYTTSSASISGNGYNNEYVVLIMHEINDTCTIDLVSSG